MIDLIKRSNYFKSKFSIFLIKLKV